ncbi:MAG: ketoacyl-ACP synthase III [Spirochaetales bacterium]|nr:ketoacyl-ACP synthase III [Spirochaetales bacterium]
MVSKARLTALGAYVPTRVLTNNDLSRMVETSDEWIVQRTGIRERRIAAEGEYTADLGTRAVEDLRRQSGQNLEDVDLIMCTTFTADYCTPSTAAVIHGNLGLPRGIATFDLNAACAGFSHGLLAANAYITAGVYRKVIVVAAEAVSKITDYKDRNTCILFGDGAAAALVERSEEPGFLGSFSGTDSSLYDKLYTTSLNETMHGQPLPIIGYFWQDGRAVYNYTIKLVPESVRQLSANANLPLDKIDWFVPHSANLRIIQSMCEKIPFPFEKTLTSVEQFGNTSSATIPLALWLAAKDGKLKRDDTIALFGFGGGLNHSGVVVRWF